MISIKNVSATNDGLLWQPYGPPSSNVMIDKISKIVNYKSSYIFENFNLSLSQFYSLISLYDY